MTDPLERRAGEPAGRPELESASAAAVPLCLVVDEEPSICRFVSLIMQGCGLDTGEFTDYPTFLEAVRQANPELVFVNIPLDSGEAIASIVALGKARFSGAVQLMSNRGSAVLEHVKTIGEQNQLRMLPVLKKPFDTQAVIRIVHGLELGIRPASAVTIDLGEALASGWIEFWYQPKIDLRRKRLVGAEAFARARHPRHGVLAPGSFMPGAGADAIKALSELALHTALQAGQNFARLGLSLTMAVNIPVDALVALDIGEIARQHRVPGEPAPSLIIDVTEEQIVSDLSLAQEITRQLRQHNIRLAIDDFGRGYSSLARLKELPFAELKLDRSFVVDCGTDKVNAPLCKTVIDLAHNFGSMAVAIGIEKAADMVALVSMGCDLGQGYLLGQPMPEDRFLALLRQRAQGRLGAPPATDAGAAGRRSDLQPLTSA